jgi:hypothetical protein
VLQRRQMVQNSSSFILSALTQRKVMFQLVGFNSSLRATPYLL